MNIEDNILKKYVPDFKKLIKYGFKKNKTEYSYEILFKNKKFKAIIKISNTGNISGKVYDLEDNEEFLPIRYLPQESECGAFIGEIREEYKKILTEIRDKCFSKKYFLSEQANRITNLIYAKYNDCPNFLWEQFDDSGVFKNPDTNKWYAIIMNINYSKLGLNNNKPVEVINLKLDKEKIPTLLKENGYYPAWHMNKKYWITVVLDNTLSDEIILNHIEESHSYTVKSAKTK